MANGNNQIESQMYNIDFQVIFVSNVMVSVHGIINFVSLEWSRDEWTI